MIKNKKLAFVLFVVLFLMAWNMLDYLYSVALTRSAFRFSSGTDLLLPLIISVVTGALLFLREKKD